MCRSEFKLHYGTINTVTFRVFHSTLAHIPGWKKYLAGSVYMKPELQYGTKLGALIAFHYSQTPVQIALPHELRYS